MAKPGKSNTDVMKTCASHEQMAKWGNMGNTKGCRLPSGGKAKGAKRGGSKGSKSY